MKYLIDTHALLWLLKGSDKLPEASKELIWSASQSSDGLYVSIASLWEIAIKQSLGKLEADATIEEIAAQCQKANAALLSITPAYLDTVRILPQIHSDPFDRLLVAQALCENLTIITRDANIGRYDGVWVVWD